MDVGHRRYLRWMWVDHACGDRIPCDPEANPLHAEGLVGRHMALLEKVCVPRLVDLHLAENGPPEAGIQPEFRYSAFCVVEALLPETCGIHLVIAWSCCERGVPYCIQLSFEVFDSSGYGCGFRTSLFCESYRYSWYERKWCAQGCHEWLC